MGGENRLRMPRCFSITTQVDFGAFGAPNSSISRSLTRSGNLWSVRIIAGVEASVDAVHLALDCHETGVNAVNVCGKFCVQGIQVVFCHHVVDDVLNHRAEFGEGDFLRFLCAGGHGCEVYHGGRTSRI